MLVDTLFNELKDKIVIFDFDGVLTTYRSTDDTVHTKTVEYIEHHASGYAKAWASTRALKTMQELIEKLNKNKVYVLSEAMTSFEMKNKDEFIRSNYDSIIPGHVMYVGQRTFKLILLEYLFNSGRFGIIPKSNIVVIEDNIQTISELEDAGFSCYHISSFVE